MIDLKFLRENPEVYKRICNGSIETTLLYTG